MTVGWKDGGTAGDREFDPVDVTVIGNIASAQDRAGQKESRRVLYLLDRCVSQEFAFTARSQDEGMMR
jgi:hypothetical protein